jgi:outer membrane protein assembly factor BamB
LEAKCFLTIKGVRKKMKNLKIFSKSMAILICLLMTLSIIPELMPTTNAQKSGEVGSFAYIAVEPNPVGVGQTTYIAMWVDGPLPDTSESNNIRRYDYKLVITAPDGTTETKTWAVVADTTGVQSTSYTPNQVGTYTFTFSYPGQTYTWNATAAQQLAYGLKFLAASATETLTVQQDVITQTGNSGLPTEYWSRPIYGENDNWYTIASHWLGGNYLGTFQQSNLNLWQTGGVGPESSHIMWTYPIESGGVVGGINTGIDGATYYSGGSYEGRFQSAIILDGKLYYKLPLSDEASATNTGGGAYVCQDLRTGKVLWTNNNINPTFGELYCYESPNQHGVVPNGYLWQTVTQSTTTQTWIAWDALTGRWLFNLTDVPSTGTIAYTNQGEIVKYILNYNTTSKSGSLALWNWTSANGVPASSTTANGVQLNGPGSGTNYLQLRPVGRVINTSTAYSWNVSITADLTGAAAPAITYVIPGDVILGTSYTSGTIARRTTSNPYTLWELSVQDNSKGQLVWKKSYDAPSGNATRTFGPLDPVNRVFTMTDSETMVWLGYNLDNGNLIWGPTNTELRTFQYFGSGTGPGQKAVTAYGNIYVQGYGGELFCYDTKTGDLLWKFNDTDSGVDTSWGLMPILISAIADGKVYAFNNEHSPNSPLYNGYNIYCLNATTGEEIYKMLSWSGQTGGAGANTAILADGSLVYYNYYDNQLYCISKGPTKTTLSAPNLAAASGQSVVISGTVIDISSGTTQNEQAARFPNGVAAASDASTSAWMEYVYMDQPKPTNFTGVPVTISVIDANGNYRTIGSTTTDSSGTYGFTWMPDIQGQYTVIATFAGNKGYYGSNAEAYFTVDEPAATSTPQPITAQPATDMYIIGAAVAIIAAIAIVGAILASMIRKRA